ncbi:hypothetical protein D3C78_1686360 [compost metagenome]
MRLPESESSSALVLVAMVRISCGLYQRDRLARICPWRVASAAENSTSVPKAVLSLYFLASA